MVNKKKIIQPVYRIYVDRKSGNRYIVYGKKRIKVEKDITERELIKFIISHLKPKRRPTQRTVKNLKKQIANPPPAAYTTSSNPTLENTVSNQAVQLVKQKEELEKLKQSLKHMCLHYLHHLRIRC